MAATRSRRDFSTTFSLCVAKQLSRLLVYWSSYGRNNVAGLSQLVVAVQVEGSAACGDASQDLHVLVLRHPNMLVLFLCSVSINSWSDQMVVMLVSFQSAPAAF